MSSSTLALTDALRSYLVEMGVREHPVLARLRDDTARLPEAGMQIAPEQGALMGMLVALLQARRIVEVGTFTGYSALAMALAMPEGGRITCCDVSVPFTDIARKAWREAGVADRIDLRIAPAVDTLDLLLAEGRAGTFDLAFVDADKENYVAYHERCLALLRPGGVTLFDNVLWSGAVIDPKENSTSTLAIRDLNERLRDDDRIDLCMVPIGDGLTFARKR
jgi:predicted O-methyltransferase YrrM